METGTDRIARERARQRNIEGYGLERDRDLYDHDQLALAAACYAYPHRYRYHAGGRPLTFPWTVEHWKPSPSDRVRELEKAGALIAAEIDRLTAVTDSDATGVLSVVLGLAQAGLRSSSEADDALASIIREVRDVLGGTE